MRALYVGAVLLLSASSLFAAAPAGTATPAIRAQYGEWRVVASQDKATGAKTFQIAGPEIVALASPLDEEPVLLRTSKPGRILRVRVDENAPIRLGDGARSSKEMIRQMLAGTRLVVDYREWPGNAKRSARASLEGFADAWRTVSALARQTEPVQAKLYEGCDDDSYCAIWTFCETGHPYCSTVTQTCQCSTSLDDGGDPPCNIVCGQGQTFNREACTCECPPCTGQGQWQNPGSCQCENYCQDEGCPAQKYWNYGTCTCTCYFAPPFGGCPPRSAWNPDLCECVSF